MDLKIAKENNGSLDVMKLMETLEFLKRSIDLLTIDPKDKEANHEYSIPIVAGKKKTEFLDLPNELLIKICTFSGECTAYCLGLTSRRMYQICCSSDTIWDRPEGSRFFRINNLWAMFRDPRGQSSFLHQLLRKWMEKGHVFY